MQKKQWSAFLVLLLLACAAVPGLSDTHPGMHSSELQRVVHTEGNVERADYVDQNGVLTYATDKRYATVVKTKNEEENTVLEEFFDEKGLPARQSNGHYALLRLYNEEGRNDRTVFLDADGQPTVNVNGYTILGRTYYSNGGIEYERYYDVNGAPVRIASGIYGHYNIYENGQMTEITYLNQYDQPAKTNSGYAILKRSYYQEGQAKGKVENEYYFDESGAPVALSLGQYGLHREYDALGRNILYTYLGEDGAPIESNKGYATVRQTFYPDNTVRDTRYYDLQDRPVPISPGRYGTRREDGRRYYLDINGNEVFELNTYLHTHPLSVALIGLMAVVLSGVCGKKANVVLLILYLAFVFYMTLLDRSEGDTRAKLELFWSYKQFLTSPSLRQEILNNIWLFIPLGAILYKLFKNARLLILPLFLSVGIEAAQYFTGLGLCEVDDVLSNTLGAVIGFLLAHLLNRGAKRIRGRVKPAAVQSAPKE